MIETLLKKLLDGEIEVDDLSYTQFVSLINQTNNPPDSYAALNQWRIFSNLSDKSVILELASTTGFSSRELVLETGARAVGLDICEYSIERANSNAKQAGLPHDKLKYEVFNALNLNSKNDTNDYTHLIIGASLKFIGANNSSNFFKTVFAGVNRRIYILSSEFYARVDLPEAVIKKCKNEFDLTPTTSSYKDVMKPYSGLRKTYEFQLEHRPETEEETIFYCDSTINRFAAEFNLAVDSPVVKSAHTRLARIKESANILRPYHSSVTLVHEYVPEEFGKRFTELF